MRYNVAPPCHREERATSYQHQRLELGNGGGGVIMQNNAPISGKQNGLAQIRKLQCTGANSFEYAHRASECDRTRVNNTTARIGARIRWATGPPCLPTLEVMDLVGSAARLLAYVARRAQSNKNNVGRRKLATWRVSNHTSVASIMAGGRGSTPPARGWVVCVCVRGGGGVDAQRLVGPGRARTNLAATRLREIWVRLLEYGRARRHPNHQGRCGCIANRSHTRRASRSASSICAAIACGTLLADFPLAPDTVRCTGHCHQRAGPPRAARADGRAVFVKCCLQGYRQEPWPYRGAMDACQVHRGLSVLRRWRYPAWAPGPALAASPPVGAPVAHTQLIRLSGPTVAARPRTALPNTRFCVAPPDGSPRAPLY